MKLYSIILSTFFLLNIIHIVHAESNQNFQEIEQTEIPSLIQDWIIFYETAEYISTQQKQLNLKLQYLSTSPDHLNDALFEKEINEYSNRINNKLALLKPTASEKVELRDLLIQSNEVDRQEKMKQYQVGSIENTQNRNTEQIQKLSHQFELQLLNYFKVHQTQYPTIITDWVNYMLTMHKISEEENQFNQKNSINFQDMTIEQQRAFQNTESQLTIDLLSSFNAQTVDFQKMMTLRKNYEDTRNKVNLAVLQLQQINQYIQPDEYPDELAKLNDQLYKLNDEINTLDEILLAQAVHYFKNRKFN